jgi:hypothetical protein
LCRELRDFLTKVSSCGAPYQQWCTELRQEFPALVSFKVACIEFYPVNDVRKGLGVAHRDKWLDTVCMTMVKFPVGEEFLSLRQQIQANPASYAVLGWSASTAGRSSTWRRQTVSTSVILIQNLFMA